MKQRLGRFELEMRENRLRIIIPEQIDRSDVLEAMNLAYGSIGCNDRLNELVVDFTSCSTVALGRDDLDVLQRIDDRNMSDAGLEAIWFLINDEGIEAFFRDIYDQGSHNAETRVRFIRAIDELPD